MTFVKHDRGKARLSLLPVRALVSVAKVMSDAIEKKGYPEGNWKSTPKDQRYRYIDASLRHLFSWIDGEKLDPESGESHLAHAACCLLFLVHLEQEE